MSTTGRGRGYTGRHHLRDPRPGDVELTDEQDAARTLSELSPRSPESQETKPLKILDLEAEMNADNNYSSINDEAALKELLSIDEQYKPLLALLEQFSPGEDGIQFNRKLKHFESTVTTICPDEGRLHQAFAAFRAAALLSSVTARKLSAVGASFTRQQRQQLLRGALLNVVMQGTFFKIDLLERSNPLFLINAANLMGDYFAEARLCNGNKVHILASPLLQYLKALLASDDIRAHRSLTTQLMQNGRELLSIRAQEIDELSISIRLRLLTPPPISIIWLLLSADLCLNKFLPLPNTLQQFYASHLDLTTEDNFSEVSYGSWKKSPEKIDKSDESIDLSAEQIGQNVSELSLIENGDTMKPKLRPILGAGAGLLRQEQGINVNQDNWNKSSLSKRYDLNSWRQSEEEQNEPDPVFNPSVLPPNMAQIPPKTAQNFTVTVPDYPPPNITRNSNYTPQESFPNYLQQGDGAYIQNQYPQTLTNFTPQGDFAAPPKYNQNLPPNEPHNQILANQAPQDIINQFTQNQPQQPEKVNSELQKTSQIPIENWRSEKGDAKEESSNRQKSWIRQRSRDNIHTDSEHDKSTSEKFKCTTRSSKEKPADSKLSSRLSRRNSNESCDAVVATAKTPPQRRHVTEVPRSRKYWDHDDRCDKDYES